LSMYATTYVIDLNEHQRNLCSRLEYLLLKP
jgi:hypothetical protein